MARAALRIEVATRDRKELQRLLSGGVQQVRVVLRAIALLQLAKGVSAPQIAAMVPLTAQAIRKIGHRYREGGLERALYEKPRPGAEALLDAVGKHVSCRGRDLEQRETSRRRIRAGSGRMGSVLT